MRGTYYQYTLIALGALSSALMGVFFYREFFPEYKIYQNDYISLENFRSSYTHEPPPSFQVGVKQIVLEKSDRGNPIIDRCTSCHVALEYPHFSPTKIAKDINGNILYDDQGFPKKTSNENYVWAKLDQKIGELEDQAVNDQLKAEGDESALKSRLAEAEKLKAFKVAHVGEHTFDVTKVLAMHPLMGKETRPIEFHPIEEYGCTSCHNGNGRGMTTLTAHGPLFDGQYEKEFTGHTPHFTEIDPENDPRFSQVFNGKPGHELLFQTTPLYVGELIQAKCMQCHLGSSKTFETLVDRAETITSRRKEQASVIAQGLENDKKALLTLITLQDQLNQIGLESTLESLKKQKNDFTLSAEKRRQVSAQLEFMQENGQQKTAQYLEKKITKSLEDLVGSAELVQQLVSRFKENDHNTSDQEKELTAFLNENRGTTGAKGDLFAKLAALDLEQQVQQHINDVETSFQTAVSDRKALSAINTDVDLLTKNYKRGEELFIAQACYACHRISGLSRGGVGPELTQEGNSYPWFIKESIVWPQADLASSAMPNFVLDHEELQDLMTFILAQTGGNSAISQTAYKAAIQSWEAGRKLPWEKPITPVQMLDLRYAMTVFATEGCASCHRLKGFDANVGYRIEKDASNPSFDALQQERDWFQRLIPEEIAGSELVRVVDKHAKEIDERIAPDARTKGLLEEIEKNHPKLIESFYTPFKFASRAKDAYFKALKEKDPSKKLQYDQELKSWKERIHNLLFIYVQEYGLGRLICPRPNWSGIYRTDEWLMEHFRNPTAHVPRSIMPIFPFDETKFYALTKMLDALAIKNRDATRSLWHHQGFNPALAYEIHCAQCHGDYLQGNGPVAPWIYPIPKNLRNAEFLRNLTRERVIDSITHGVKGTPMPPWGEVADDKPQLEGIPVLTKDEIERLTDWFFSTLPGGTVIRSSQDVPKWRYSPEDVIEELQDEGTLELFKESTKSKEEQELSKVFFQGKGLLASLEPQAALQANEVSAIFDIKPNPKSTSEPLLYYIKKEYYTPENIEQGRLFFELNCAVCHGKEADGSGARAGTMIEAKPRMLTNLDWINTRDDLRLIRSIKYGVPGTSMTPWGDQTSAFQRLQLVMFIRTLTKEKAMYEQLSASVFRSFDRAELHLEENRMNNYAKLLETQKLYEEAKRQRELIFSGQETDQKIPSVSEILDQEKSLIERQVHEVKIDELFTQLKNTLKKEKELYLASGRELIQNQQEGLFPAFDSLINQLAERFKFQDGIPSYHFSEGQGTQFSSMEKALIDQLENKIKKLKAKEPPSPGKLPSVQEKDSLQKVQERSDSLMKLKNNLIANFSEAARLRRAEQQLVEKIKLQANEYESREN